MELLINSQKEFQKLVLVTINFYKLVSNVRTEACSLTKSNVLCNFAISPKRLYKYTMQWFVGMVEVWIGLTCVTGSHATRHLDITTPLLGDHSSTDWKFVRRLWAPALSDQDRTVHVPHVSSSSVPGTSRVCSARCGVASSSDPVRGDSQHRAGVADGLCQWPGNSSYFTK